MYTNILQNIYFIYAGQMSTTALSCPHHISLLPANNINVTLILKYSFDTLVKLLKKTKNFFRV